MNTEYENEIEEVLDKILDDIKKDRKCGLITDFMVGKFCGIVSGVTLAFTADLISESEYNAIQHLISTKEKELDSIINN